MYQVMCRQTTRVMTEAVCGYRIGHFVWINTGGALSTARGRMFKHRSLIELHFQKKKKNFIFSGGKPESFPPSVRLRRAKWGEGEISTE